MQSIYHLQFDNVTLAYLFINVAMLPASFSSSCFQWIVYELNPLICFFQEALTSDNIANRDRTLLNIRCFLIMVTQQVKRLN